MPGAAAEPSDPTILLPSSSVAGPVLVASEVGEQAGVSSAGGQEADSITSEPGLLEQASTPEPSEPTVSLPVPVGLPTPSTPPDAAESPTKNLNVMSWVGSRVLPVLALIGICVWAWAEISDMTQSSNTVPVGAIIKQKTYGETSSLEDVTHFASDDEWEGELNSGLGRGILSSEVELLDTATQQVSRVELSEVLTRKRVSVVNLWATWCEGCKKEFAQFSTVFNSGRALSAWGAEVQFITMLVDDAEAPLAPTYKKWAPKLPEVNAFAAVREFNDLQELLQERKLLRQQIQLPVTFVLDCRRQVRWIHLSALNDTSAVELHSVISELREELNTARCKAKKKTSKRTKKRVKPQPVDDVGDIDDDTTTSDGPENVTPERDHCGNGKCEPSKGETITSCSEDCLKGQQLPEFD